MKIINSYTEQKCPFCGNHCIRKCGNIQYTLPVVFADTPAELTYHPELWECLGCGSKFTQYIVPEETAIDLYSHPVTNRWDYGTPFEGYHTETVVNIVREVCQSGMQVLDIGCSTGYVLDYVKGLGCRTYGIEYSDRARGKCIRNGHTCYQNSQEIPADTLFDRILCFDVLEHVYAPGGFLDEYTKYLVPGGIAVIITGDIECRSALRYGCNWWYIRYPEHIRFPSEQWISGLPQVTVIEKHPCYASRYHGGSFLWKALLFLNQIRLWEFNGYPAFTPDHMCILLQKKGVCEQ